MPIYSCHIHGYNYNQCCENCKEIEVRNNNSSDSTEGESYWKQRCEAAEAVIINSACWEQHPDIDIFNNWLNSGGKIAMVTHFDNK